MQTFDILRTAQPSKTFRVSSVMGSYDIQNNQVQERFTGQIDMPEQWNVGLIVGRSGSGKTTIAKELFPDAYVQEFEYTHESILDDFPKECSVKDICGALSKCGFSTPPSWLKSYSMLSNGEKMRCDIARAMLESKGMFVFDEFTSVVDRNVAKIGSLAIQNAIRKNNRQFIAVTCHYDVQEWLMPDWVFNTDTMQFSRLDLENQKKNRPELKLDIFETKHKDFYWNAFKKHHYLSHSFNKAARTFVGFVNGQLACFCAVLPFPHPILKNVWRVHRIVTFPDFQGIGLAYQTMEFIGRLFKDEGKIVRITTSSISMINSLKRNKNYRCQRFGRVKFSSKAKINRNTASKERITAGFEYIGWEQC